MPYGLTNAEWDAIGRTLLTNARVEKVILFGSRAKGTHKPGSDVDLALVGQLELNELLDLHERLDELSLPYHFDLLTWSDIDDPALRAHIERVGVRVIGREMGSWIDPR